eukprot:UN23296
MKRREYNINAKLNRPKLSWKKQLKNELGSFFTSKMFIFIIVLSIIVYFMLDKITELGLSLCGAIFCMLLVRAAHDKFIFPIPSLLIRLPTALAIPIGVLFFEKALYYEGWCLFFVCLSYMFDLVMMERFEIKEEMHGEHQHLKEHHDDHGHGHGHGHDSHGHHDSHSKHKASREEKHAKSFWKQFLDGCGFVDAGDFSGAFAGPKYEGDPRALIYDVFCCQICDEPAPAPRDIF